MKRSILIPIGYATFLPTIIKGINPNFSRELVQVLTIPCYSLGAVSYIVVGHISDWQQRRGIWVVILGTISVCGYGMLVSNGGVAVHYAGCFLVAAGMFVTIGLPLAWLPTNIPRYGKRTTTIAMQAAIGNSAGILSSFVSSASDLIINEVNANSCLLALSVDRRPTLCQRSRNHHVSFSMRSNFFWLYVALLHFGK